MTLSYAAATDHDNDDDDDDDNRVFATGTARNSYGPP